MKNKFYYLLLLTLFTSCSKDTHFAKGEINKIEEQFNLTNNNFRIGRLIAQSLPDACQSDEITEEKLIQEIKILENTKSNGSKAVVNGLDLSKFPANQAVYLEKNKEWIYTQNLDLSDCRDVSCLFSKIYPNSKGIEGYLNYYFYLKMGYALSTVNKIPEVTLDANANYQDTLFSRDELNGFYFLSKALSTSFQKLPTLSSIHRMQRNMYIQTYGEYTCGLAGGAFNKGYIILLDKCLTRTPGSTKEGNFYPLATHELSHRLDYNLLPHNVQFSETKEWLDLSGWYIKENINQATGATTSRQWAHEGLAAVGSEALVPDGFIRDYAATSPAEDFADSVGFSRFTPDEMQKKAPRKYEWISKHLFDGKSYTANGLGTTYITYLTNYTINSLPAIINNCVINKSVYSFNLDNSTLSDYAQYDPELVKCIFGGIGQFINSGLNELKKNELEACKYFSSNELVIKKKVLEGMNDFIKKDLSKNIEIGLQLKTLAEFISRTNEEIDPREIFITCQDNASSTHCYQDQLTKSFTDLSEDYKSKIPNQLASFQAKYLEDNNYNEVKAKLTNLFNQIFSGTELKFTEAAKVKWKTCFEAKKTADLLESEDLILSPFSGGTQYVKKDILNCLNKSATNELIAILDKVGQKLRLSISSVSLKNFILEMYLANFTQTLQSIVEAETNKEEVKINELEFSIVNKVTNDMTANKSWMGNVAISNSDLEKRCLLESSKNIEIELTSNLNSLTSTYNFHTTKNNQWHQQICKTLLDSREITTTLENIQSDAVKNVLPNLKDVLIEDSASIMLKCKVQFSKNNAATLKARNICLTNLLTWKSMVDDSINKWISNENISFIPTSKKKGQDYLQSKKPEIQNELIKKMNSN